MSKSVRRRAERAPTPAEPVKAEVFDVMDANDLLSAGVVTQEWLDALGEDWEAVVGAKLTETWAPDQHDFCSLEDGDFVCLPIEGSEADKALQARMEEERKKAAAERARREADPNYDPMEIPF